MREVDKVSNRKIEISQTDDSKWDMAIQASETELAEAEHRVSRLRSALRIFKEQKAKGVPWPGEALLGREADSCADRT
jgi:hypothetical protein